MLTTALTREKARSEHNTYNTTIREMRLAGFDNNSRTMTIEKERDREKDNNPEKERLKRIELCCVVLCCGVVWCCDGCVCVCMCFFFVGENWREKWRD